MKGVVPPAGVTVIVPVVAVLQAVGVEVAVAVIVDPEVIFIFFVEVHPFASVIVTE